MTDADESAAQMKAKFLFQKQLKTHAIGNLIQIPIDILIINRKSYKIDTGTRANDGQHSKGQQSLTDSTQRFYSSLKRMCLMNVSRSIWLVEDYFPENGGPFSKIVISRITS